MAVTPEDLTSKTNNALSTALGTEPTPLPIPKTFGKEAKGYIETMQPLMKESAQAEGELKKFEYETQAKTAKNKAKTEREYIQNVQNLNKSSEEKEAEFPRPEFHPTQENALSLGSLFSLVSTIGLLVGASGKQSAGNAMNAMTGMLKGWQTGRKDLYEKELKEFDKEYKRITDVRNEIQKKLEKSIQLQTSDKEASFLELESARALADSNSVLGLTIRNRGAQGALELLKGSYKLQSDIDAIKAKKEEAQANRDLRLQIAKQKETSTKGGAANARYAFNINESFAQAATDVLNIAQMPKNTVLGTFAGLTGQSGDTLTSSLRNTLTRKALTKDDERLMQQVVSGLEFNMSRALGGGYASSGAKYMIDIYKQQVPKEGDSPIATAMFLARIKQELGVLAKSFNGHPGSTPEYVQQMGDYMKQMDGAIPFNVSDVINASRKGKATISDQATKIAGVQSNVPLPIDRTQSNLPKQTILSPQDQEALDWANNNPETTQAKEIKKRLGVE
jgi:hypothetical protein